MSTVGHNLANSFAVEKHDLIAALAKMIESSAVAAIVTDPHEFDNPIVASNEAFLDLTGYELEEVLGRNCRFLAGPDTQEKSRSLLRAAVAQQTSVLVDILNYRKDGSKFRNSVMIAPVFDSKGRLAAFLGSQAEIPTNDLRAMSDRQECARHLIASLSPRQREVVAGLASGKLIKQLANELKVHERTIKMHRAAAIKKLGVQSTAEAIRLAVEAGF